MAPLSTPDTTQTDHRCTRCDSVRFVERPAFGTDTDGVTLHLGDELACALCGHRVGLMAA